MIDNKFVKRRWLNFMLNIFGYKPRYVCARIFFIGLCAVLVVSIAASISGEFFNGDSNYIYGYLYSIAAFNVISELNLLFINILSENEYFKWKIYAQGIITCIASVGMVFGTIFLGKYIFEQDQFLRDTVTQITVLAGFLIILIHLLFIQTVRLMNEWVVDRKEIDDLRQAKLVSDYNSLKDRLNPHFLFNNLSVLQSLIRYNPSQAEVFTRNFTNVYRYVLDCYEKQTITVAEELLFLESYIALHRERIGEHLNISIDVDRLFQHKEIPPLSLQLLIENAIKHNVVNKRHPLYIKIYAQENSITVENNLKERMTTYSTKTGLSTLDQQYQLIANKTLDIHKTETTFTVTMPLL